MPEVEGIIDPGKSIDLAAHGWKSLRLYVPNDQKVKLVAIKLKKHASIWWERLKKQVSLW